MKKAQSAMEYLMTYGWAILIVIIVAAALYALGIFNPATYTGRIPTGFTTLGAPTDWDLETDGDFAIILNNRLASQIEVQSITINTTTNGDVWSTYNCTGAALSGGPDDYMTIGPGATKNPSTACTNLVYDLNLGTQTAGTTYSVDVSVLYNAGDLDHTESGRVTGTVQ